MKTVRFETRKLRTACAVVGFLLLFPVAALPADDRGPLQPVLREEPGYGQRDLPVVYLDSLADAVHRLALDAGVVLCLADGATDPAFDEACAADVRPKDEMYRLRWNADLNVKQSHPSRQAVIVTLSMDVYHAKKAKKNAHLVPPPKNVIKQVEIFVPAEYSAARREDLIGAAIYETFSTDREIRRWFSGLADFENLLLPRPAGDFPPPSVSRYAAIELEPAPAEIGPEQLKRWEQEKDRIADLLIDDQAIEARESAAALLQEEGLPEDIAQRVRELHDVAVEKAARQAEPIEIEAPPPPPAEPAERLDVTFEVRYAPAGSGFRAGIDGKLYVSHRDIRFVPAASESTEGWAVKWPALAGFGAADGVWDVTHPLYIETTDGDKYFVTERLPNGRYGNGQLILDYIGRGRDAARSGGGGR